MVILYPVIYAPDFAYLTKGMQMPLYGMEYPVNTTSLLVEAIPSFLCVSLVKHNSFLTEFSEADSTAVSYD